jgi:polyisoprenoid-binding protein YceI
MRIQPHAIVALSLILAALPVERAAAQTPAPTSAVGAFEIDATHSNVGFTIRHLVSKVSGRFTRFTGSFDWDPAKPAATKISAEIDATSVNTDNEKRDGHLNSPDFFDTAKHPKITFQSTGVTVKDASHLTMNGNLTMRGVTKPVTLDVEVLGTMPGARGQVAGFEARGRVNRKDFGVNWNRTLDQGGVVLGDDVDIVIQVEAMKKAPQQAAPEAEMPKKS